VNSLEPLGMLVKFLSENSLWGVQKIPKTPSYSPDSYGMNKKASIRWQNSAPPISGYWPTRELNAG